MKNKDLFKIGESIADEYVKKYEYPFEVLPNIEDIIYKIGNNLGDDYNLINESNNLVELGYYNAKLVKFGAVDFSQNPVAVRIDSLVRGPVILKFRTEEPVDAVYVSYNDSLVALF